jgi:hypothetical protein
MTFVPLSGLVNIAAIALVLVEGFGLILVPTLIFFFALQYLMSLLAIELDNEDNKLALYSPLLVVGYKQICDFIIVRSFIDVLFRKRLKWTSVRRTGAKVSKGALS